MAQKSDTPTVDWELHYRALLAENEALKDQVADTRKALGIANEINVSLGTDLQAAQHLEAENARLKDTVKNLLGDLQGKAISSSGALDDRDQMVEECNEALIELYRLQGGLDILTHVSNGRALIAFDELKAGVDTVIAKLLGEYDEPEPMPAPMAEAGGVLIMPPPPARCG